MCNIGFCARNLMHRPKEGRILLPLSRRGVRITGQFCGILYVARINGGRLDLLSFLGKFSLSGSASIRPDFSARLAPSISSACSTGFTSSVLTPLVLSSRGVRHPRMYSLLPGTNLFVLLYRTLEEREAVSVSS